MSATIKALVEESAKLVHDAKALMDEWEGKDAPTEVKTQIDRWLDEADTKKDQADGIKADTTRRQRLDGLWEYHEKPATPVIHSAGSRDTGTLDAKARKELEYKAFRMFANGAPVSEIKALSLGTDVEGGVFVSTVINQGIIQIIEDDFVMRRLATVAPPIAAGQSAQWFAADTELADATWTTEIGSSTEDTVQPFGGRQLTPHKLSKLIKASNASLRLPSFDLERWVTAEFAKKHGRAEEAGFMTGTGAGQPFGVFTSGARGTDVAATSTTDIAADDVIEMVYTLKPQYERGASIIAHRTICKELRKLKDGTSNYLWERSLVAGQPDMLMGYPIYRSEFAPSSSATGLYVLGIGNWKAAYMIQDAGSFEIQRLSELYSVTDQTGFIGRKWTDGAIVDGNGVVRLKMA